MMRVLLVDVPSVVHDVISQSPPRRTRPATSTAGFVSPLDIDAANDENGDRYASASGLQKRRITEAEASFHLTNNPYLASCTVCGKPIERKYAWLSGRCFRCRDVAIPVDDNPKNLPPPSHNHKPHLYHRGRPGKPITTL